MNQILSSPISQVHPDDLENASGPVTIRMSNDYLFRALLQTDIIALRGLICALLHLKWKQITSLSISNPIELGTAISDKDFILDIKILLNQTTLINLELQVINEHDWQERSLSYLCRAFDNLNKGDQYRMVKPAIHIGLLDFPLFPQLPEFYATYQMMNIKNHALYSDKLRLSVVDLTHIDVATEEDRQWHIDKWAALFKATTWEEIKMIAQKDEIITNAATTVWKLTQDEQIRQQCEAREDYRLRQLDVQYHIKLQDEQLKQQATQLEQKTRQLEDLEQQLNRQAQELDRQAITLIGQIRIFSEGNYPPEKCAAMLMADLAVVNAVYAQIRESPDADNASILETLKSNGLM